MKNRRDTMKMGIISVILIALLLLFQFTDATTYMVGDGLNWIDPPTLTTYSIWASTHVFVKGDVLVFNFNTGIHNVAEVTKEAYTKCNTTSPISIHLKSPVSIPLPKRAKRYFISTLNSDCESGQKVAINVLGHLPPPPPPGPPPETTPAAAPDSNNSAPSPPPTAPISVPTPVPPHSWASSYSFGSASLFSVFVCIIVGLLCQLVV